MIREAWTTIERALEPIPDAAAELCPGASPEAIERAAGRLGVALPQPFVESYRIHDGQDPGVLFVLGEFRLQRLEDIVSYHGPWVKAGGERSWIGFADNGGNTTVFVDAGTGPTRGRIVELCDGDERTIAADLGGFLSGIAASLESGEMIWDEKGGGFATQADIEEGERFAERDERLQRAFEAGPSLEDLRRLAPGAEVEIVGMRVAGGVHSSHSDFAIRGGVVRLRGSLRGADTFRPIRVRVRVGGRRLLGLGAPIHQILSWEPFEPGD